MDYPMLNYLPSTIAASCVTVALWMLGKPTWTPTLTHYSGYAARDLRHCAQVGHSAASGLRDGGGGDCSASQIFSPNACHPLV